MPGLEENILLPRGRALAVRVAREAQAGKTAYAVWHATKIAVEYAAANPSLFAGKTILDLGCGTGWLGMAVASLYPSCRVYVSDLPEHQAWVEENLARNGFFPQPREASADKKQAPSVSYCPLDITSPTFVYDVRKCAPELDVIFAAELFHQPDDMEALLRALPGLLAPYPTTLYVLHMHRNTEVSARWVSGLERSLAEVTLLDPDAHRDPVYENLAHYRPHLFFHKVVHPAQRGVATVVRKRGLFSSVSRSRGRADSAGPAGPGSRGERKQGGGKDGPRGAVRLLRRGPGPPPPSLACRWPRNEIHWQHSADTRKRCSSLLKGLDSFLFFSEGGWLVS